MSSKESDQAVTVPLQNRFPLERRQFLMIGSAALVGLAAADLKADVLRPSTTGALPQSLSVAYVGSLVAEGSSPVEVADRMTVGDPSFLSTSARVSILGLWRAESRRREALSVTVKAYYPTSLSAGGDAPMFAWNQTNRSSRDEVRPASFVVPIDDAGLRLEIESRLPQSAASNLSYAVRRRISLPAQSAESAPRARAALRQQANVASLSLGIESGMAKLRRGTYVVALLPAGVAAPNWQSVRYMSSELGTAGGPVASNGLFGQSPVDFDYIVIAIDFAR